MLTTFWVNTCHKALGPSNRNLDNWSCLRDAFHVLTDIFATVLSGY